MNNQGKIPPQALEAEDVILGALMLEESAMATIAEKLRPQMFYSRANQIIFEALLSLFNTSMPIDIITVSSALRKVGKLEEVGGAFYITSLTNRVSSAANIEHHTAIIAQKYLQREMIKSCAETIESCYNDQEDIFEVISKIDVTKDDLLNHIIIKQEVTNSELLKQTVEFFDNIKSSSDGITGVESGFVDLDRITGGWQKSDLIIIAARPAMGKTSFVIQNAINASRDFHKTILFFSLEMSSIQLMKKQMSINTGIALERFRKNQLTANDWGTIHSKYNTIADSKIIWDDSPGITITEIRAKSKKLKRKHDIDMVIIDYLQLINPSGKNKMNREQEVAYISRSLKQLAKELDIPIIVLSQLSRATESRADKRPMLSDLRESGSLEQDADMVLFLYRPEYYQVTEYENGASTAGIGEIIIAKHRNGATDDIMLQFIGETTSFKDMDYTPFSSIKQEDTHIF